MAVDLMNSETKGNLMRAFAGESQARNRYTFAAGQARQQKLYVLERIFQYTADQEKEHAEIFYNFLKEAAGETIHIDGGYPVDISESMAEILRMAQHNEMEEAGDVYQAFGKTAREEGFLEVSSAFIQIARIEAVHGKRFGKLAELLEENQYFESRREEAWMCLNCGHIYHGKMAPQACPVCRHPRGYFIPASLAPYLDEEFMEQK